jgi:hypothetical protein
MYKQILNRDNSVNQNWIFRIADNASIPICDDNTDYQEYLKWVAEGNTPIPAENT